VVVREHRFDDRTLDDARAIFQQHVDVGSMLLDDWIAERYEPGPIFGRYEVMQRR
jgi:hypothetical protein